MINIHFHPTINNDYKQMVELFINDWQNDDIKHITSHSSGSTGKPKSILLSKKQMIQSAKMTGEFFHFKKGQSILLCLSPEFIAGKMMLVRAITWEMEVYIVAPDSKVLNFPNKKEIDFVAMVPNQLEKWMDFIANKTIQFKAILLGGANISLSLEEKIRAEKFPVYLSFGMTETTSHIAIKNISLKNQAYKAIGSTTFSTNSFNQLIIHSPELEIDKLITNDVIELLSPTEFHWKGRLDYVINSGGIKYFPEELEKKIQVSGLTKRFFIFGQKDEKLGEIIAICIEGKEEEIDKKSILAQLNRYEKPKNWYFLDYFEETNSGKLNRIKTQEKR
jgi:O-succinylbenzoic acid--CoA ligase